MDCTFSTRNFCSDITIWMGFRVVLVYFDDRKAAIMLIRQTNYRNAKWFFVSYEKKNFYEDDTG